MAHDRRLFWLSIALLFLLPLALFWQVWWPAPSQRLVFEDGDFVTQHFPMRSFVAREYRAGRVPLWSPYTFGGESTVAESLYAVFYPLGLWEIAFPELPFLALELEAIAYLGLAGIFTFLLVRRLTDSEGAGLLAGLAFALGGFLTSYPMLQLIILQVALWLPAGLWLLERALQRRSLLGVSLAGVAFGIGILGGHFQTFLYVAYLTAAYFVFRIAVLRLGWRFALTAAALLGLVVVGVGAPQWLPSLEMAGRSPRAGLAYEVVSHGFALEELWGLLRPNWGEWSPLYVGVVPLALALYALSTRRRVEVWFWGGALLVGLCLSLGRNGFLYPLFHAVAPGFDLFRDQERAAFLVSFALAVLAGYGYALLVERGLPRGALLLLGGLLVLDLFLANGGVILQSPPDGGYAAETPALAYLQEEVAAPARISSEALLPLGGNAGLRYELRDVTGNGPLYQAMYEHFLETVPEVRWWQLLNVRYVLTRRSLDFPGVVPALGDPGREERLYRLELAGRPAWIVHDVVVMPDQAEAIRATSAVDIVDVQRSAVLEQQPLPAPEPAVGPERVEVTGFGTQRVTAEVRLSAPGVVLFSEIAYPGWVAYVDGERVPVLRAFGVLRAVALPAGEWEVEWRFRPTSVYIGLGLATLTLAAITGVGLFLQRRCR